MPASATHTFLDPHELTAAIRTSDVDVFVTEAGTFRVELTSIQLYRLSIMAGKMSLPLIARTAERAGQSVLFFPTGIGSSPIYASGKELVLGDLAQPELGGEHHLRMPANAQWGNVYVSADELAAAGHALLGRELRPPRSAQLIRPDSDAMLRLRRMHRAIHQLALASPEMVAHPEVAKANEAALLHSIVNCLETGIVANSIDRLTQNAMMRRFEQRLEAGEGQPLYVLELCRDIGVSERGLRRICMERLAGC
jgi:hypothetical protein